MDRVEDLADAFLMIAVPNQRLNCIYSNLDREILDMVVRLLVNGHICNLHMEILFQHCPYNTDLCDEVAEILASGMVCGRLLTKEEEQLVRSTQLECEEQLVKLLKEEDDDGGGGGQKKLHEVVWDLRKSVQQYIQVMHDDQHGDEEKDQKKPCFSIRLGCCHLPTSEEVSCDEECKLLHDQEEMDVPFGWDHAAHMYVADMNGVRISEHMLDILSHMTHIMQTHRDVDRKEERQRKLAPLITEVLIIQACVFPICNEDTKVGPAAWKTCFGDGGDPTVYLSLCHEFGRDDAGAPYRTSSNLDVAFQILRGGGLVQLVYNWQENDDSPGCECHWCASFDERHSAALV